MMLIENHTVIKSKTATKQHFNYQNQMSYILTSHLKVLSLLIRKYPLREYCDLWNWVIVQFLTPKLEESDVSLYDLIQNEQLRQEMLDCLVGIAVQLSFLKPLTASFIQDCVLNEKNSKDSKVIEALKLLNN